MVSVTGMAGMDAQMLFNVDGINAVKQGYHYSWKVSWEVR